jgi:hypothetical protein
MGGLSPQGLVPVKPSQKGGSGLLPSTDPGFPCYSWKNQLDPNVKHGDWKDSELEKIKELHAKLGNKWAIMAKKLPGR